MEIIKLPQGEIYAMLFSPLKKCGLQAWIGFFVKDNVAELAVGTCCRDCENCEKINYEKTTDFHQWLKQFKSEIYFNDPKLEDPQVAEAFEALASNWVETLPYPVLLDTPSQEKYKLIKVQMVRSEDGTTHFKLRKPVKIGDHEIDTGKKLIEKFAYYMKL